MKPRRFVLVINGGEKGRYASLHKARIKGSAAVILGIAACVAVEAWVYRVEDDQVVWAAGHEPGGEPDAF